MRMLLTMIAALVGMAMPAFAQPIPGGNGPHIATSLVPESLTPAAGTRTTIAIAMAPQPGWHGYWQTPGDSGFPMKIDWTLPKGAKAGDPAYPVPTTLVIAGLMNHVYEKPYALLVPVDVPAGLAKGTALPVSAKLDYLVCTTSICVPETATVSTSLTVGDGAADPAAAAAFAAWRKALPRPLGSPARSQTVAGQFRLAVPLPGVGRARPPASVRGDRWRARLCRAADLLARRRYPRDRDCGGRRPAASVRRRARTGRRHRPVFSAAPGAVPAAGAPIGDTATTPAKHGTLVLTLIAFAGAVLGGLILNVMPCVFPILSLKALSLAKGGGDEREVRREALAYAAGVIAVCMALGGLILAARAGGAQIGWAFQLQDPGSSSCSCC